MSEQNPHNLPVDISNPHLTWNVPATMKLTPAKTPGGPRLTFTLHVGNATATCYLTREDAENWSKQLADMAPRISEIIVVPNGSGIQQLNGGGPALPP